MSPGKTPKTNLQFLTFFINTIKAVHDNADLLRASIASASNDHRLGANEAPPAIVSIFIGSQLTQIMEDLEKRVKSGKMTPDEKTALKLDIGKIPDILLDNTDRNRTSPFAFTGNKFEFRAVGSSANCAGPMTVLNAIMADQLCEFKKDVDALTQKDIEKDEAIFQVLVDYIKKSKKILFEGNGYSDEWKAEAKKRGLSNFNTTPAALDAYLQKKSIELFERHNIMTHREQEARHDIYLENYTKKIQIESRVMADLALNHIIPTAIKYQKVLVDNVSGLKNILDSKEYSKAASVQFEIILEISEHMGAIKKQVHEMIEARKKANAIDDHKKQAEEYCDKVKAHFDEIRYHADKLELVIDDENWPLPKYRELLFTK